MRLPKLAESSRLAVFFNGVFASPFYAGFCFALLSDACVCRLARRKERSALMLRPPTLRG
jgi:hypothetical protein